MSILGRKALTRSLATHATAPLKNYPSITPPYAHLLKQLSLAREILNRPFTLAEKIVYSHLDNVEAGLVQGNAGVRGNNFLKLRPDRVAMQGELICCLMKIKGEIDWIKQMHRLKWLCCNFLPVKERVLQFLLLSTVII